MAKLIERMANRRLIEHLVAKKKLDQHAFRPRYYTGAYLATLGRILDDAQKNGVHVEMAALYLAKTYNRAWTPGVLDKLTRWRIKDNMLLFVKNFLDGRTFQVVVRRTTGLSISGYPVPSGNEWRILGAPKGIFVLL